MTVIVTAIFGFTIGVLCGLLVGGRHLEWECETAYLTGHVDGYSKAVEDGREDVA